MPYPLANIQNRGSVFPFNKVFVTAESIPDQVDDLAARQWPCVRMTWSRTDLGVMEYSLHDQAAFSPSTERLTELRQRNSSHGRIQNVQTEWNSHPVRAILLES